MTDYATLTIIGFDWMPKAKRFRKIEFEWHGDPEWPFRISGELLRREPGILDRCPWPIEKIGEEDPDILIYRRTDSGKYGNKQVIRGEL